MKKAIFSLILGACSVAHADFYTGNDLLERMQDPARSSIAMGYVAGVVDMGSGEYHCAPPDATLGQIRDMVRNYLINTPANRHMSAAVLVTVPLMNTWPCPKKKGSSL